MRRRLRLAGTALDHARGGRQQRRWGWLASLAFTLVMAMGNSANSAPVANGWSYMHPVVPPGAESSELSAVDCRDEACVAVGRWFESGSPAGLAEVWTPGGWRLTEVEVPRGAIAWELSGVSCWSDWSCVAVGDWSRSHHPARPLIERWDGGTWRIARVPLVQGRTILKDVDCVDASTCVAVGGSGGQPFSEILGASGWRGVDPVPPADSHGGLLLRISCPSAGECISVGNRLTHERLMAPMAELWRDGVWRELKTKDPDGVASGLDGVACATTQKCLAVGSFDSSFHGCPPPNACARTLAELWDGDSWRILSTPNPRGALESALVAVSCIRAHACTAVGFRLKEQDGSRLPLVEHWVGGRWSLGKMAFVRSRPTILFPVAVACTVGPACTAVGQRLSEPLAEREFGG
jgi:hypothetical protein